MKTALIALFLGLTLVGCTTDPNTSDTSSNQVPTQAPVTMDTQNLPPADTQQAQDAKTIVDIAAGNPEFSTLVTAVTKAGLAETLSSEGPFTVFAPTNAAFEKLPEGILEAVLANKDQLTSILTYHVVSGKVSSDQVVDLDSATTIQGGDVAIRVVAGQVMINDANVVSTDIEASNGIIHVIDTVLMP